MFLHIFLFRVKQKAKKNIQDEICSFQNQAKNLEKTFGFQNHEKNVEKNLRLSKSSKESWQKMAFNKNKVQLII